MGRVLLAGLTGQRLAEYFDKVPLVRLTDRTVTDRNRLEAIVEEARRAGFAAVEDELAYGVVAVAVPVFDSSRRVVAALNSSSHSRKFTKARLVRARLAMLRKASTQISRELSRVPGLSLSVQA
jgi:IclR family pca regulon transcriptional regulator